MKCPKCAYLGFDTGERCRNCGYDFSLMPGDPAGEVTLREDDLAGPAPAWLDAVDHGLGQAAAMTNSPSPSTSATPQPNAAAAPLQFEPAVPPVSFRGEPALPLFGMPRGGDDEPLIKVPSAPRPPLSVRRTPDARLRGVPKTIERVRMVEPELDFAGERPAAVPPRVRHDARAAPHHLEASGVTRRLLAAAIDHAILFAIDAAVLYLTLRIAQLTMSEWRALSILPMVTFLGLLKLSYFTAFTCVGGQTIGKMAAGIRVVGEDDKPLDAPHAMHRALAGAISFLILGAGFVPALLGSDRRALHDRLAHTRVVALPTA
jgi:uncharacterized RDD family membrane protein YckC